jgi:RNA polymerase sigma-70 factor (ECF subfamily)
MDEYSHKEISELLSISTGTSKSNLHRAKLILKKDIQEIKKGNHQIAINGN